MERSSSLHYNQSSTINSRKVLLNVHNINSIKPLHLTSNLLELLEIEEQDKWTYNEAILKIQNMRHSVR